MANVDVTRIAGNIGAMNALNSLQTINKALAKHQTALQTGKRINSAADDPAGYTIATKMMARSEGLKVALDNISDASNMLSVAEGGLSKINDILVQIRGKAEQAASDTLGQTERQAIQTQISAFAEQIDNVINETKWNGTNLLDGTANKQFQTGTESNENITWTLGTKHDASTMGVSTVVAGNSAVDGSGSTIFSGAGIDGSVATFPLMSRLQTGSYKIDVGMVAQSSTVGDFSAIGSNPWSGVTVTASGAAGATNGSHAVSVTNYDGATGHLDYSLDGVAQTQVTLTDGGVVALGNSGLNFSVATAATATIPNGTFNYNYVKANTAQFSLKNSDGSAIAVDTDGVSGGATGSSMYATLGALGAAASVNTGRGVSFTSETLANLRTVRNTGSRTFNYAQQSNYSVDVSTATKAATYMNTISTAMDGVNTDMAGLGSLMARLDFKADATTTAQVNVEASYNRIMNANMAEEQMNASKYSILQQTATAMLAQANQAPQSLLSLFR
jgi:flagellin